MKRSDGVGKGSRMLDGLMVGRTIGSQAVVSYQYQSNVAFERGSEMTLQCMVGTIRLLLVGCMILYLAGAG